MLSKQIHKLIFVILIIIMMISSCTNGNREEDNLLGNDNEKITLQLKINSLASGETSSKSNNQNEKIKSLRIIIIDSDGKLEVNEKAELDLEEYYSSDFNYIFKRYLNGKDKHLYFIANEESINKIELTETTGLPSESSSDNLTEILDSFIPESEDQNLGRGEGFEKVLNHLYFKNDFTDKSSENSIYLPYASYYKLEKDITGFSRMSKPFYLVPVATKIEFKFVSYRKNDIKINDIAICSINNNNYLNAQLAEEETIKTIDGIRMWWIDWLEACALASQTTTDYEDFNNKWGWIENYRMPTNEQNQPKSLKPTDEEWVIKGMVDKNNPDKKEFGPFYLPESHNPDYSLTFNLEDMGENKTVTLEGCVLENLKVLFRGTHVIVNVELYQEAMDIYAEIVPWQQKVFIGYLQQEDD